MAQGGRDTCDQQNRVSWLTFCGGVAVAFMVGRQNPWAGLCVGFVVVGLMTTIPWSQSIQRSGEPALMAAATYLALTPLVSPSLIVPILWVFVFIGCWAGAWTVYSGWRVATFHVHFVKFTSFPYLQIEIIIITQNSKTEKRKVGMFFAWIWRLIAQAITHSLKEAYRPSNKKK